MKNHKNLKIPKALHRQIKAIAAERKMKIEGVAEILLIKGLEVWK